MQQERAQVISDVAKERRFYHQVLAKNCKSEENEDN